MSNVLTQYLEKMGLKGFKDLTPQERQTYKQYEELLERKVTLEDLKNMLPTLIGVLSNQLVDPENSKETDLFLKARIKNLKDIEAFVFLPERNRKALEATFKSLLTINK